MKKATNPLALDLRAGGFEVFPIAKLFDLPSNVWYPSILIRENMLAEPFAAWAANTSPGDVDVVFTARWRSNNRPLPEASYYPFDVSEPTNRVSRRSHAGAEEWT